MSVRSGRAGLAVVPLRVFLGGTFTYAGLDKLLNPAFLTSGSPGSIQAQLAVFARHSPIGGLVLATLPFAVEIGLLIAIAEIAIGIGALSGIGFRLAAAGGLALSILFWLTASWTTRPYYYGPDLPYAAAWLTLLLAGPGGWVAPARLDRWIRRRPSVRAGAGTPSRGGAGVGLARRTLLEAAVLGAAALITTSIVLPLRRLGLTTGSEDGIDGARDGQPSPSPQPSPTTSGTPPPGVAVTTVAALAATGVAAFTVPFDAPAPLPAGSPAIVVHLPDGTYAAFGTICPHAGCTVEWDGPASLLVCPCHGAIFDPVDGGAVLEGPAEEPLAELPLYLDAASGTFLLRTG